MVLDVALRRFRYFPPAFRLAVIRCAVIGLRFALARLYPIGAREGGGCSQWSRIRRRALGGKTGGKKTVRSIKPNGAGSPQRRSQTEPKTPFYSLFLLFLIIVNPVSPAVRMKVSSIDCRRLRRILRRGRGEVLVVDCRPYFSFSGSSIRGSVNANLNSVVVRRSRGGPVPLRFVIPDEKALFRLRQGSVSAVVALDDRTPHFQKLKKDSTAQIVIHSLAQLPSCTNICFLKGGFESFHSHYPELCTEAKATESCETERGAGHCERLSGQQKHDYHQGKPVELLPFLYLGSAHHACRNDYLSDLRITALLNVSRRDSRPAKGQHRYKWIPVEDSHTADISSHFQEAIDFIDEVKQEGGKVLVHCEAGISRSPTICMAYLMKKQRLRLEEAFEVVRQRRAIISPNFSFMGQLLQFEAEVLSSTPPSAPPATAPCQQEAASFFNSSAAGDAKTDSKFSFEGTFESSMFTFPTSFLPSPFKLSPITALP
ncbi:dual specificity protein phosphatase 5 [Astyanax mexicanus]|uniref:Dual specificity phosphatase 5 n=1 Tax=Astyanax mexicanus TaxID=7994 RepID=A0A8B9JBX4_ASTMX|nr:dual specificity protein phosphatase 5 [Astyanax mexicanus]